MQGACQVAGVTTEKLGHKGITGTQYPPIAVKQEDDGALRAVVDTEVLNAVDIDIDCTRQLQNELYEEYVIEEASRLSTVVYVIDSDSNNDGAFEEWSDPDHDLLVEIDRRLREQEVRDEGVAKKYQEDEEKKANEQEEKDAELARRCAKEAQRKALEQVDKDNQVARMCQALYEQNATDEQIEKACAHAAVGDAVHNVAHKASQGSGTPGVGIDMFRQINK
ncbi:uncharacterized protein LOC119310290 [Triticum dicoccoides]|uniref:uncharacterized protein LOC119310290 n=1 Tax=Triticum dicoccoides TaxID=85692 RepID=UPI000E7B64EB|nr:uncharacterized protein LOC119310290 [Triticum dicoccoides]XP_037441985.1 uncharacterized protein LOC119310290 [Triticum dicoccoides]XP_037441986.1 uncharacterized protein LOC119310290 [Triticum dicoccoides]